LKKIDLFLIIFDRRGYPIGSLCEEI
jgi:hypothetical protein